MAKIFISYARKDAGEIADELADQLRAKDHEVFLDVQSIRAGARWRSELSRRIKWSNLIIVLVTEGSNESDYVYQEIREAEQHGKTIVPVKVGDAPLPVHLRGTWHAITLQNDNLDAILLEIQSALLHSSGSRTISPVIVVGAVVGTIIVGILAFMLLQNGDDNQNMGDTSVAIGVTETETPINTPTNTPEPPTATDTDLPTPTITLTRTPRPTSTPRPPTNTPTLSPTPTDIPQELMLYEEDFEDGNAIGTSNITGTWRVTQDSTGNYVYYSGHPEDQSTIFIGSSTWSDYAVSLRFAPVEFTGPSFDQFEVCVRCAVIFNRGYTLKLTSTGSIFWERIGNGAYSLLTQTNVRFNQGDWNTLYLEVSESAIRTSINGQPISDLFDTTIDSGGIFILVEPGLQILFDDIRVWSLDVAD